MNKLLMIGIALSLTLIFSCIGRAENLLPDDTSFEAGNASWLGGQSVEDSTATDGKYVLQLTEPFNHSRIYDDLLQPSKTCQLSFYARKVSGPGHATFQVYHVRYAPIGQELNLQLTTAWQRYELTLPAQPDTRTVYFTLNQPDDQIIQIDSMMLNEGTQAVAFETAKDCMIHIGPTKGPGNILLENEDLPALTVGLSNRSGHLQAGQLKLRTVDWYGKTLRQEQSNVTLNASESHRLVYVALPQMTRGYFQVIAEYVVDAKVIAQQIMPFGVVAKPASIASMDSSFGIHPDISRVQLQAMDRIGARWLRVFGHWEYIQRKGEQAFDKRFYALAKQLDMSVLYSFKIAESMPSGPWDESVVKTHAPSLDKTIQWLSKYAPKAIKVWEIENEPDLCYPTHLNVSLQEGAKAYGQVLNVAAKSFKKHCPDQAIAAMAVSGNESDNQFITQANQGNEKLYDIASVHPYNGARFIGPSLRTVAPDAYIRQHLLDKANAMPDKRLWAGEIGWIYHTLEPLDSETYRIYSNYTARALILMKSVPQVEKVIWFKAQGAYDRKNFQYGLWRSEFEPTAGAVFYANIARQLDGATPYKPVYESDLQVYTFTDRNGDSLAAAWRYKGQIDQMLLDIPASRVHVTDLLDNPVHVSSKHQQTVIPISNTPVWIRIDGMNVQQLADKLQTNQINIPAVTITPFLIHNQDMVVFAKNNLQQAIPLTLRMSGSTERKLNMAPSQMRSVTLHHPDTQLQGTLVIDAITPKGTQQHTVNMQSMRSCPMIANSDKPFEQLEQTNHWIDLHQRGSIYPPDGNIGWNSPADLSGRFACGYDSQYYYFLAHVTDPVHDQTSESYRAWNGDSLQLTFDTLADAREGEFVLDDNDCELIAWLSPSGPKIAMTHSSMDTIGALLPDAKVNITRKDNLTTYQLAIPWQHLEKLTPMAGRLFGFNFIINQNNGQGRRYWLGLTEGVGEGKYPYLYNTFRLTAPISNRQ